MNRERLMQLQIIEQEANQLNQQSELIEQSLKEMQELKNSLEEINKHETKEILVNIGRKIYVPVEIKSKELIVEVGEKSFVKKSISETEEIIKEQIGKLINAKSQIGERLQELEEGMSNIIVEGRKEKSEKNCKCKEDEECECDDCSDECDCGENCKCED